MSREDKQMELAIGIMTQRINEMKNSLAALIYKLEFEFNSVNMPVFLDAFSLISGQLNTLMRLLKSDKVPMLKALTVLPLSLSQEKDTNLLNLTDSRLACFNHEVVPDYLRTKPDPEVESRHTAVEMRANQANQDTIAKQAAALTKLANHVIELINSARDDWEATERSGMAPTYSMAETHELVAALYSGKPFRPMPMMPIQRPSSQNTTPASQGKSFSGSESHTDFSPSASSSGASGSCVRNPHQQDSCGWKQHQSITRKDISRTHDSQPRRSTEYQTVTITVPELICISTSSDDNDDSNPAKENIDPSPTNPSCSTEVKTTPLAPVFFSSETHITPEPEVIFISSSDSDSEGEDLTAQYKTEELDGVTLTSVDDSACIDKHTNVDDEAELKDFLSRFWSSNTKSVETVESDMNLSSVETVNVYDELDNGYGENFVSESEHE